MDSFALSGLIDRGFKTHLIVSTDKEAAAYTFNTLKNILPDSYTHFLPDSFKRPLQFDALNSNQILQRSEVINELIKETDRPKIVVSYPEALIEKVVSPKILTERKLSIRRDEVLDLDELIEKLLHDYDAEYILEVLGISAEELVEQFQDRVVDKFEMLEEELFNE
jgi:transcription-repair coupling factor (superfamily II helicase)